MTPDEGRILLPGMNNPRWLKQNYTLKVYHENLSVTGRDLQEIENSNCANPAGKHVFICIISIMVTL